MSSKVSYAFLGDENSSSKNASAFPLATITVQEPSGDGPGWDVPLDLDLTGLASATLTSGAVTTVTRAGSPVADVWSAAVSNAGTTTANATGITCDGNSGTGSVAALIDIEAAAGLTLPQDALHGVAVDIYLTNLLDWSGAGTAWRAGISVDETRFSAGTSNTVQGLLSTTVQNRRIATDESFTTVASGEALPVGAWVVTLLVLSGEVTWAWYGTTAPSDATLDSLSGAVKCSASVAADITDAPAGVRYGAALYAGIQAQLYAKFTMTRIRVRTRRLS